MSETYAQPTDTRPWTLVGLLGLASRRASTFSRSTRGGSFPSSRATGPSI